MRITGECETKIFTIFNNSSAKKINHFMLRPKRVKNKLERSYKSPKKPLKIHKQLVVF